MIGVSVPTLRRLEQRGELACALVDQSGVHWHSVRRLLEYKSAMGRAVAVSEHGYDGEIAARAFDEFDRGVAAADLVKSMQLLPAVAQQLEQQWAEMRGRLILSARAIAKLQDLVMDGDDHRVTEETLLATIAHQTFLKCTTCRSKCPEFCIRCIHHSPERVRAVIKARVEAYEVKMASKARDAESRTILANAREAIVKE